MPHSASWPTVETWKRKVGAWRLGGGEEKASKQVKLVVKRIVTKQLHVLVVRKLYSVGDLKLCENDLKNVEIPK
jgi:hypothetical protein